MNEIPISVVAIAKNEKDNIDRFFECINAAFRGRPFEIVVDDTGSDDGTREIIQEKADVAGDFAWVSDFSKARNHSLSLASYDWVLVLDCDEFVISADWEGLQRFIRENPGAVGRLKRKNSTFDEKGNPSVYTDGVERFFDRRLYCYEGSIHEQVRPRPDSGTEMVWGSKGVSANASLGVRQLRHRSGRSLSM